ncbi:MAG: metal ABC transporter substrate-binding protein [Anaerolineaceae bacterium]
MKKNSGIVLFFLLFSLLISVSACTTSNVTPSDNSKMNVVATTSIVADIVANVGGDRINLSTLVPLNVDVHSFEPTPRDLVSIEDAEIIFINGGGLEAFIDRMIESTNSSEKTINVSDGVTFRHLTDEHEQVSINSENTDPHTWTDPNNVMIWVKNIEQALSKMDPDHSDYYAANAKEYLQQLQDLDQWIQAESAQIPVENRKLITDHLMLGYFADRYDYQIIGAVIPSYSTMSQPSAKEISDLINLIQETGAKAILIGKSTNPAIAERISQDANIKVALYYTGSLSTADEPASTYLDYMRANVNAIIEALQ